MNFLAKLVGFLVMCTFAFAFVMGAFGGDNLDKIEQVKNSVIAKKSEPANPKVELSSEPTNSSQNLRASLNLVPVQILTSQDVKDLIAEHQKVMVVLDNQIMKNPFIGDEEVSPVVLSGFTQQHFIAADEFVYVIDDVMTALLANGSKVWIME